MADLEVVQLRHESQLTSEEYVKQRAWESASLERCPLHPAGGCGIAKHTPYSRVEPPGMKVARSRTGREYAPTPPSKERE